MDQLYQNSVEIVGFELARAQKPVVLWSSGKDSMVLLAMVRLFRPDVPVIYLRAFNHPTKHFFAEKIMKEWGLNVIEPLPAYRDVVAKGDHVELIEVYQQTKDIPFYFPIEAEPDYQPGANCLCAIDKLNAPKSSEVGGFDSVFIGHRGDDVDPVYGAIPVKDYVAQIGDVRMVYPLKDWSEADIWEYSRWQEIPQNDERYVLGLQRGNNDYYPLCTRCLESKENEVFCPKAKGPVHGLGNLIDAEQRADYWRKQFINIERAS
jgi:3'-phosphoadenosine 5'-phosphosulfate sulfotransferase (PAPS reductase)/FAD synthetase